MKSKNLILASVLVLSTLGPASIVSAKSASGDGDGIEVGKDSATATTTAEFNVEAGKLSFDSAPDFNFGSLSIVDMLKGQGQLDQKDNLISDPHNDSHTSTENTDNKLTNNDGNNGNLQISDYRGSGSSWVLNASISEFTNKDGKGSVNGVISLPNLTGVEINGSPSKIWDSTTAGADGQGTSKLSFDKGASLALSGAKDIQSGKYNATITWTLGNTTTATSKG
ncbi:WxL domain-containing protein [Companilactobacillus sp. DQM5]|uniref:WxL domain-containing protein n=1 Tax=Companilactobacillus sp. DQM5 TaxID=3463359 RepID=UPI0040589F64